jgi:hypothetical protein
MFRVNVMCSCFWHSKRVSAPTLQKFKSYPVSHRLPLKIALVCGSFTEDYFKGFIKPKKCNRKANKRNKMVKIALLLRE